MLFGYFFWTLAMLALIGLVLALMAAVPLVAAMWPLTLTALAVVIGIGVYKARKHGRRDTGDDGEEPF